MSYTKGKWKILADGLTIKSELKHQPHYDVEPPQTLIAKCFQNGHLGRNERPTEEDKANARLIAAAPLLYEACKILCNKYVKNLGTTSEFVSCITPKGIPDYWRKAEAALAAADG